MSKIKLKVLGISYSQTQSGAYALVLTEEKGERRIPIIVGGFEAQAIAIQLEGLKPPRPLTHDLFLNFAVTFKIDLIEVVIHKLEEGVFYSRLLCKSNGNRISIDARTSDAIALALRFKCPIYTTEEILRRAGIVLDISKETKKKKKGEPERKVSHKEHPSGESPRSDEFVKYDIGELKRMLQEEVKKENYERASVIRDEIARRKKSK